MSCLSYKYSLHAGPPPSFEVSAEERIFTGDKDDRKALMAFRKVSCILADSCRFEEG